MRRPRLRVEESATSRRWNCGWECAFAREDTDTGSSIAKRSLRRIQHIPVLEESSLVFASGTIFVLPFVYVFTKSSCCWVVIPRCLRAGEVPRGKRIEE